MAREGDKWRVVRGDCLWNIAKASYGNPYKWTEIADANGVSRRTALIYPGQLLTLPGITAGSTGGGSATPPPSPPAARKVTIQWWALDAGTTRDMFCTWTYNRADTAGYNIEVWYDTGVGGWRNQVKDTTTTLQQYAVSVNANAKKVKLKIKPYSTKINSGGNEVYKWTDGEWIEVEYDFRNNPPLRPSTPTVELKDNKLTCSLSNIDEDINGTQIEFAVYKNNTIKYQTGIANINLETRFVSFVFDVEDGGIYTVRCRAIRNGNIYSNWSDYTNEVRTAPIAPEKITDLRPEVISEQGSKQYGVYIEWTPVTSAKNYVIEYTTNPAYFDVSGQVESITTDENQGNKYLITNIEIGHTYYFRVCASNDSGKSDWTPIATTSLGSRPSAPTTWSNVQNSTIGQDLKLYWVHNSTDGSLERIARLHITAVDLAHPELAPTEFDEVIRNTKPEEDRDKTSVYVINTTDTKWSFLKEGFVLKWKVQTAGVAEKYSEYSVEREINVYMPPEITIDVINQNGQSMDDISSFPFYIKVNSKPASQTPISYYLEIVANSKYDTVDPTGKKMVVNAGDRIYQRYYDPTENPWSFLAEMTPGNIDLKSGISYTVNCTVAMNSSLTASNKQEFNVVWTDSYYNVGANIILNKETLEASIHPYCNEYYIDAESGNTLEKLAEDCTLSVYRREYNGTYTLIDSGINNSDNTYIIDPHPALDYARYRVTATSNKTGSISYADIEPVYFGIPSFVVQWNEEWVDFDSETSDNEESKYSNSMIQIPYNVDISETANVDVTLIEYIGREHPVSYYGTHLGESFTANVEIPKSDTNLIYQLRRLAKYAGDVYVREPSGIGYWANISVQFSMKHKTVTIPVSFTMKRVEGGI